MDNSAKLKYQKYKSIVKSWEEEFMKNCCKLPSRSDIKNAPESVRHAYKAYYSLRKVESLNSSKLATESNSTCIEVNKANDGVSLSQDSASSTSATISAENLEADQSKTEVDTVLSNVTKALDEQHGDKLISQSVKPKNDLIPVFSKNSKELKSKLSILQNKLAEEKKNNVADKPPEDDVPKNVKGAWEKHLNSSEIMKKNKSVKKFRERTSSFQFAEKLFVTSQFKSKRNPLKPRLRRTKSECFSLLSQDSSVTDSQEDNFTSQPSPDMFDHESDNEANHNLTTEFPTQLFSSNNFKVVVKNTFNPQPAVKRILNETRQSLDPGWIARCTNDFESSPIFDIQSSEVPLVQTKPVAPEAHANHEGVELSQQQSSNCTNSPPVSEGTSNQFDTPQSSSKHVPEAGNIPVNHSDDNLFVESSYNLRTVSQTEVHNDGRKRGGHIIQDTDEENEIFSGSDSESKRQQNKRPAEDSISSVKKRSKMEKTGSAKPTRQEVFEKKMASGRANENFVRINIKKKIFVRGKKNTSYSKYKKMMYKKKQVDGNNRSSAKGNCFTCGEAGHWANKCPKVDSLLPVDEAEQIDDSPYLTLEEAGALAEENKPASRFAPMKPSDNESSQNTANGKGDSNENENTPASETTNVQTAITAVYPRPDGDADGYLIDTPLEVLQVLKTFGYQKFRAGQEEAIMRILSGMSTLVMLSTGAGKSLCYQLPAYLYAQRNKGCITLVVSPLVSLMEDQVCNLPKPLVGACLHTNQTPKQRKEVEEMLKNGGLHVLLVSPETVVQSEQQGSLGGVLRNLPPIAFACIDEAHCVSQWSHNFRPAYLMLCKVLRERLGIKTVLGLTATATSPTAVSIAKHLNILDGRVISDMPMPSNLIMSVSRDVQKDAALIKLLQGPRFSACESIIIYCIRREECERVAGMLRTCLKDPEKRESQKLRALSWNAESYHAGLTAHRRKQVQKAFMSGKLRIVVATVAFGMGINKNDLRAVVHYNMPSSFERFVQEVGRAGRDGLPAQCHLFLDSQGKDLNELRRHIYADSTDRHVLRKLLHRVFKPCKCKSAVENLENWDPVASQAAATESEGSPLKEAAKQQPLDHCPGHEVAFLTQDTVQALDLPEENILTLLCYLELHPKHWIEVMSPVYVHCKVISYAGPATLKAAARKCPPLAMAIALDQKSGVSHDKSSSVEFEVVEVASCIGWDSGQAKRQLKELEWRKDKDKFRRTSIVVQLSGPGLRVRAKGCLPTEELDEALDWLMVRVEQQEKSKLAQLEILFTTLTKVSYSTCDQCLEEVDMTKCDTLKDTVKKYFSAEENQDIELQLLPGVVSDDQVRANVCSMVGTYADTNFTGRAMARIFHGISSPCFPSYIWGRTRFWRLHLNDNFSELCRISTAELLRLKS